MKYTTVLFDLDGTLTRSEEGITKTAIYAAEKMGFTGYTPEQFKVFIGPPLFDSFRKVVGMTDEQAIQANALSGSDGRKTRFTPAFRRFCAV